MSQQQPPPHITIPQAETQHKEIEIQTTPRQADAHMSLKEAASAEFNHDQNESVASRSASQYQSTTKKNFKESSLKETPRLKKQCDKCTAGVPQQRLKQLQSEGNKLKSQNDKLITNLREMSAQLDITLEKVKQQQTQKASINVESSREVNEKELENAKQQIEFYSKRLDICGTFQDESSSKRMGQWYAAIKEIDDQLEEAKILNKNLLYIKRDQERTMFQNKDVSKLKGLRDEVVMNKSLLRDAQKVARENEKGFKKTQEHTNKLKQRHEEVCQMFGVPFAPFEALPKNEKASLLFEERDESNLVLSSLKVTEETMIKIKQDIKVLDETLKTISKQTKVEQKSSALRLKELEDSKDLFASTILSKEREIAEAQEKISSFRNIYLTSQSNLDNLKGFTESSKPTKSSSLSMMAPYKKKYKETRKEMKGLLVGSGPYTQSFEDSSMLPETKDQSINQISFWFCEDMIMGLETIYQMATGELTTVPSFDPGEKKDQMKQASLTLSGTEYIISIEGFYNFFCLEFLRILTSRGNQLEVGSKKNLGRCKKFSYEIRKNEIPVAFLGSVDLPFTRKEERIKDYGKQDVREKFKDCPVLINFGIEVRKKDVYQELPSKSGRPNTGNENQAQKNEGEDKLRQSLDPKNIKNKINNNFA